jgi:hypothetical protein
MNTSDKNILVLFHRDHDGVASAYCAWRIFGDAAEYHSVQYGEPFPEIPQGSRVFIVDFSWPHKTNGADEIAAGLLGLAKRCSELVILDHHAGPVETALGTVGEWLAADTQCDFGYRFNRALAGVELAWTYFRNYSQEATASWPKKIPYPLQLIADRDLWRHEKDPAYDVTRKFQCQALHEGLFLIPHKWGEREWFESLDHIITSYADPCRPEDDWADVISEGTIALRCRQAAVESIIKNAYFAPYRTAETGTLEWLPTVESAVWQSEIAHALLEKFQGMPAAVVRYRKPLYPSATLNGVVRVVHSIRSRKGDNTALRIALANGGGGQPEAAGFTTEESV